ncbi:phage tail tape measure C-terminal domain-containing protein [Caballeronia sp. dw_19]|uniref:phage tail tape measure C-terminal domain-containing protein n=1 Tax=Caballeronia sp. dw_19 TaxID=2719791 RepID=UPI001BCFC855
MSNESVTRVTADASGYRSELDSARKSATAFMQTQDQAAQRVAVAQQAIAEAASNGSKASASAINSFVSSLTRAADTAGKTRSELLELKAAQLGVSDAAAASIAKLKAVEEASNSNGEAMHSFSLGSSAARKELIVLAHEAATGSWKNFGGSLLVLGERTDALTLLLSPLGLGLGAAAAATAGFIYEVVKGASSLGDLGHQAQLTNGYLGLTTDQLGQMSVQIAGTSQSITSVQAAMTALVSSGQIAADQLSLATKVTAEFANDTGVSAEKAAESMIRFAEDPQKALQDLQSQYHTFSASQVDVIENYIKTGDSAAAYKAILQGMDEAHDRFKANAQENIGVVQKMWQLLKADVIDTINHISQIGVATTESQKLADAIERQAKAQRDLAQAKAMPFGNTLSAQAELDAANAQVAAQQKIQAAQQKTADAQAKRAAGGDAAVAVNSYINDPKYATPLQQRTLAIQSENAAYAKATKDVDQTSADFVAAEKRHADNLTEIDKQYANRNGSKAAASAAAAAAQNAINAQLTALDAQQHAITKGLSTTIDHIKSLQQQGVITQADALQQEHDARAKALQDQLAIEKQEVDIATGKKQKSAMEKYAGEVKATQAAMVANDQQYTDDSKKLQDKRKADLDVLTAALTQQLATQQAAADAQLAGLSLGSNDKADFDRQLAIRQDYDNKVAALAKAETENKIDPQQHALELAATQDYYDKSIAIAQQSSADIGAANADWTTGALRSIANYSDQANNVAASTASAFADSFRGMEDAFATFVTTGKLSFTSLATSVISDIARMQARAAISGLFNFASSAISSYFSPTSSSAGLGLSGASTLSGASADYSGGVSPYSFHLAAGGAISGPGTSTSDSIPILASNGEGMLNARAMQKIGVPALNAMNSGNFHGMLRFANGGAIGSVASSSSTGGGVEVNLYGAPEGTKVQQSRGPNGGLKLDVIMEQVDQYMAKGVLSGKTKHAQATQKQYGLNRMVGV